MTTDIAKLVQELNACESTLANRAADALEAQAKEIEVLRAMNADLAKNVMQPEPDEIDYRHVPLKTVGTRTVGPIEITNTAPVYGSHNDVIKQIIEQQPAFDRAAAEATFRSLSAYTRDGTDHNAGCFYQEVCRIVVWQKSFIGRFVSTDFFPCILAVYGHTNPPSSGGCLNV